MVLYRKYRPYIFDEVVGQEHIVRTLKNQVKSGRLSHAYLFSGSRGTGKTTVAKILARAVNCETPIEGSACGKCETCQKIAQGNTMTVIEIDAASHNGVDNIREMNEQVQYAPAVGHYKVYIIDEVHMLSSGAFNALLKTLEEPPEHVIFILATTDPQKIPATILSRCQRYAFKRLSIQEITDTMKTFMHQENIAIEDEALAYIAQLAEGGMRDALSLLEQCISFYDAETITLAKIQDLLGTVDKQTLLDMVTALIEHKPEQALRLCDKIYHEGRNIRQFVTDLIGHCRDLLILKTMQSPLLNSAMPIEKLRQQAQQIEVTDLMAYIKQLAHLENELHMALPGKLLLEVTLLKLCETPIAENDLQVKLKVMAQKIEALETKIQCQATTVPSPVEKKTQCQATNAVQITSVLPKAVPKEIKDLVPHWQDILQTIDSQSIRSYCQSMHLGYIEGDILYVIYEAGMEGIKDKFFDDIQKAINHYAQKEVTLQPIQKEDYAKKAVTIYGTNPQTSSEVNAISNLLKLIHSKINFDIEITNSIH